MGSFSPEQRCLALGSPGLNFGNCQSKPGGQPSEQTSASVHALSCFVRAAMCRQGSASAPLRRIILPWGGCSFRAPLPVVLRGGHLERPLQCLWLPECVAQHVRRYTWDHFGRVDLSRRCVPLVDLVIKPAAPTQGSPAWFLQKLRRDRLQGQRAHEFERTPCEAGWHIVRSRRLECASSFRIVPLSFLLNAPALVADL